MATTRSEKVLRTDQAGMRVQVGLVGCGIQKSRTPAMHEAEGEALGVTYSYSLFDPEAEELGTLSDIIARAEADGFAGLNITYPFKQEVLSHLDTLSEAAKRVGAVNTVVFRNGTRSGHNTDYWGYSESFRRGLTDAPRSTVLQIGAGGAGGALAHALVDLGTNTLLIHDTRAGAAEALAQAVNAVHALQIALPVDSLEKAAERSDGIVNATPVGMAKLPGMPIDPSLIRPDHWVSEIVYFPRETLLLRTAKAKGCRTLDGSGMAVFQAVRAFKLFTELDPSADRMRATFEALEAP